MSQAAQGLAAIRQKIDAMDADIHGLLMQRGELIAALQAAKGIGAPGGGTTAMHPAREARVIRALVERHTGDLPLAALERIWREIIASFTQLQAPFKVMLAGADQLTLCEIGRYYFGISTPLSYVAGSGDVLDAVAAHDDVAGVIVGDIAKDGSDWWARLAVASDHPARIVARLPFLIDNDETQAWRSPAFIVSRANVAPSGEDATLIAARGAASQPDEAFAAALGMSNAKQLARSQHGQDKTLLFEVPGHIPADNIPSGGDISLRWLGGYAVALRAPEKS